VNGVAALPDGRVVSASSDETLRVWNPDTGESLQVLEEHTGPVNGVAALPDGRRVVSASWDKTLRVWDADTGAQLAVFRAEWPLQCCAVTPAGRTIVAGDAGGVVHFLRWEA
jgi:WD40 repeat protein